jgi:hypothetical protein
MKIAPIFATFIIFCLLTQGVNATVYQKNFVLKEDCTTYNTSIWQTVAISFSASGGLWLAQSCIWYDAYWKNSINASCNYNLTLRGDIHTYYSGTHLYGFLNFGIINDNITSGFGGDDWGAIGDCAYFVIKHTSPYIQVIVYSDGVKNVIYSTDSISVTTWHTYSIVKNDTGYYFYIDNSYIIDYETINFTENITVYVEGKGVSCAYPYQPTEIDYIYFISEFDDSLTSNITCGSGTILDTLLSLLDSRNIKYVIDNLITLIESAFNEDNIISIINTAIYLGTTTYEMIGEFMTYVSTGLLTFIDNINIYLSTYSKVLIDSITTTINLVYTIIHEISINIITYIDEETQAYSIIKVLPLILLLSIPTIVVYYKIGEFATIPMFMFMSIVAYATQLMPLWILVISLIGCVMLIIQKQRGRA